MQKMFGDLFLSVGAMKAGTTWLYSVLEPHPQLCFTPEKEIHYFYHRYVNGDVLSERNRLIGAKNRYLTGFNPDRANIDRIRENLRWVSDYLDSPVDDFWYRKLFPMRDRHVWRCDFSNLHSHLPAEVWPRISDNCERLRVLYTMRHPLKRLWSHLKFHLKFNGRENMIDGLDRKEVERLIRDENLWMNAEYGQVLRRIKAHLEPDQIKVMFFEDMMADKLGAIRELETFLDIREHTYPHSFLERPRNQGPSIRMPDYLNDVFAPDIERIMAEVEAEGLSVPSSWRM